MFSFLSPSLCFKKCAKEGFQYAGIRTSDRNCFCGSSYSSAKSGTSFNMKVFDLKEESSTYPITDPGAFNGAYNGGYL